MCNTRHPLLVFPPPGVCPWILPRAGLSLPACADVSPRAPSPLVKRVAGAHTHAHKLQMQSSSSGASTAALPYDTLCDVFAWAAATRRDALAFGLVCRAWYRAFQGDTDDAWSRLWALCVPPSLPFAELADFVYSVDARNARVLPPRDGATAACSIADSLQRRLAPRIALAHAAALFPVLDALRNAHARVARGNPVQLDAYLRVFIAVSLVLFDCHCDAATHWPAATSGGASESRPRWCWATACTMAGAWATAAIDTAEAVDARRARTHQASLSLRAYAEDVEMCVTALEEALRANDARVAELRDRRAAAERAMTDAALALQRCDAAVQTAKDVLAASGADAAHARGVLSATLGDITAAALAFSRTDASHLRATYSGLPTPVVTSIRCAWHLTQDSGVASPPDVGPTATEAKTWLGAKSSRVLPAAATDAYRPAASGVKAAARLARNGQLSRDALGRWVVAVLRLEGDDMRGAVAAADRVHAAAQAAYDTALADRAAAQQAMDVLRQQVASVDAERDALVTDTQPALERRLESTREAATAVGAAVRVQGTLAADARSATDAAVARVVGDALVLAVEVTTACGPPVRAAVAPLVAGALEAAGVTSSTSGSALHRWLRESVLQGPSPALAYARIAYDLRSADVTIVAAAVWWMLQSRTAILLGDERGYLAACVAAVFESIGGPLVQRTYAEDAAPGPQLTHRGGVVLRVAATASHERLIAALAAETVVQRLAVSFDDVSREMPTALRTPALKERVVVLDGRPPLRRKLRAVAVDAVDATWPAADAQAWHDAVLQEGLLQRDAANACDRLLFEVASDVGTPGVSPALLKAARAVVEIDEGSPDVAERGPHLRAARAAMIDPVERRLAALTGPPLAHHELEAAARDAARTTARELTLSSR